MLSRILAVAVGLAGTGGGAWGQSSPSLYQGQVPTATQWNGFFTAKADANSGTLNAPAITAATITGSTLSGWTPTFGVRGDSTQPATYAGTGYAVNDSVTLADGCQTHAILKITGTSGGLTYNVTNAGSCTVTPSNPVSVASTTGSGVGAQFTVQWAPIAATLPSGSSFNVPVLTLSGAATSTFGSNVTVDLAAASSDVRYFYLNNTLAPSTTTSNVWEQMNSFAEFSSGTTTGEINLVHSYFQVDAGAHTAGSETYEASNLNNGTMTGLDGLLVTFRNGTTGTVSNSYTGVYLQFDNDNTTANSVAAWVGIACYPMNGAGSHPTFQYCLENNDSQQIVASAGPAKFGNINNGSGALNSTGADNSHFSYNQMWFNNSNSVTDFLNNDGNFAIQFSLNGDNWAALTISDLAGAATWGDHIQIIQTTAPTITSGTATLDSQASDVWGTVTEGTSQTGFTLTFNVAWHSTPHCVVTSPTGNTFTSYTPSTTTLVVANASQSSSKYTYMCGQ